MRKRGFRIALALVLATASVTPTWSQYVLNLREADIRAFIEDAARVTGRTFIIDSSVQGKVSVVTQRPLSRSEYFEVFLSTLRANGLVAVPAAGGAFRIQPVATAATTGRVGRATSPNNFVTEIFRLRNIDAASAAEAVRPLVSREGSVTANRNTLIVADFADNIARIRQILSGIDRDTAATQMVTLENAGAREIADALTALVPESGEMSVVPIDSSNSIALRGDAAIVTRMVQLARELDERAASGAELRVVFLEHADAEQLLPVLQRLVGQAAESSSGDAASFRQRSGGNGMGDLAGEAAVETSAPRPAAASATGEGAVRGSSRAVVTRFEGANAIVIAAPADVQRMLGEVIRQLDIRRAQVLVEAIIVEISNTAAKELGVQLFLSGLRGSNIPFAVTNYSNISPNMNAVAGALIANELRGDDNNDDDDGDGDDNDDDNDSGDAIGGLADSLTEAAVGSLVGSTGGLAGGAFRSGNAIFGAIINAVQRDNNSNILSTPSIMTLDNQEARILVGQEIPITTGEALSDNFDNAFRTVQRQNVGITLEVKPQINAGGTIKLDLRQEVSSIAGPVSDDFNDLILNKRELETTITVDDGEIVGIGGLLDDNERRTLEKIPLLGDIPLLGELFKSRGRSRAKTNLMVFIRPTILRSADDARAMTQRRYGYIRGMQYQRNPDMEPTIDELVREYMGAVPPAPPPPAPAPTDPSLYAPAVQSGDQVVNPVTVPESEVPK